MKKRMSPDERKTTILKGAIKMAQRVGYKNVTREKLSEQLGVAPSLISHYFGTVDKLQRAIMKQSIKDDNYTIISQGIVDGNALVNRIEPAKKHAALNSML